MDWYTRGSMTVPAIEETLLAMGVGLTRKAYLLHDDVDIRSSLINLAMQGLFSSPRIALNAMRVRLDRKPHRRGVGADGRRVAFEAEAEILDHGG